MKMPMKNPRRQNPKSKNGRHRLACVPSDSTLGICHSFDMCHLPFIIRILL